MLYVHIVTRVQVCVHACMHTSGYICACQICTNTDMYAQILRTDMYSHTLTVVSRSGLWDIPWIFILCTYVYAHVYMYLHANMSYQEQSNLTRPWSSRGALMLMIMVLLGSMEAFSRYISMSTLASRRMLEMHSDDTSGNTWQYLSNYCQAWRKKHKCSLITPWHRCLEYLFKHDFDHAILHCQKQRLLNCV